jgi:thiol-disulfide isomerase/thioredoxin
VRRRATTLLAAVLGLGLLVACGAGGHARPAYAAEDLRSGEPVSLAQFDGEPILLVSWTTWCTECDELLSGLAAFAGSPAAEGIAVVAVNLDAASVEDEIDAKLARHEVDAVLWRDRRNEFRRVFGAPGVPTAVVIGSNGEVGGVFPGAVEFADGPVAVALDDVRGVPAP